MAIGYISDGYTAKGYIAEKKGLHPALRFEYRPMLVADRTAITAKMGGPGGNKIMAAAMASRVLNWDLTDHNDNAVKPTEATILRLQPELFYRLFLTISGSQANDADPEASDEQNALDADALLQAAISGSSVAEITESNDAKN